MDGSWLSALDRIASRERIESCATEANVFGRRNDLAEGAFVHGVRRLVSIGPGRSDAKACVRCQTCLFSSITSPVGDSTCFHCLLQDSWLPPVEKVHVHGVTGWISIGQDPRWVVWITVVFGDMIERADIKVIFDKDFGEAGFVEWRWASGHSISVGGKGHVCQGILDIEVISVPAGGESHGGSEAAYILSIAALKTGWKASG